MYEVGTNDYSLVLIFFALQRNIPMLYNTIKKGEDMCEDLRVINEEIQRLKKNSPSMEKYQRLGILYVCKEQIEKVLKTTKNTTVDILEDKMEQIGARATLVKLEPILSKLVKDIEMIAPTISGEFIKQLKEM